MALSAGDDSEWFAPRPNRRLRASQYDDQPPAAENYKSSVESSTYSNATFMPDTPIKHQFPAKDLRLGGQGLNDAHSRWEVHASRGYQGNYGNTNRQDFNSDRTYFNEQVRTQGQTSPTHRSPTWTSLVPEGPPVRNYHGDERVPGGVEYHHGYQVARDNPFLSGDNGVCEFDTSSVLDQRSVVNVSNNSSDFEQSEKKASTHVEPKHERKQSAKVESKSSGKSHKHERGFNIPSKAMSQDEGGYLNRSNTSLNKSQISLRGDEQSPAWNVTRNVGKVESSPSRGDFTTPPRSHISSSFNVQQASPASVVQRVSQLVEGGRFEECNVLLQKVSVDILRTVARDFPVRRLISAFPQSLGVLQTLYERIYNPIDLEAFPLDDLLPGVTLWGVVEWLGGEGPRGPPPHTLPPLMAILGVTAHVTPEVLSNLAIRKRDLDQSLQELGSHGVVEIASEGAALSLADALRIRIQHTIAQLKGALQQCEEPRRAAKGRSRANSASSHLPPTAASHQRLLQLSQKDVQRRLVANTALLEQLNSTLSDPELRKLELTLANRVNADRHVLSLCSVLGGVLATPLSAAQVLAPAFQRLSMGCERVLGLARQLPDCQLECAACDARSRLWEVNTSDKEIDGSTTSFTGTTGQTGTTHSHAPLDRDRSTGIRAEHHSKHEPNTQPISIPVTSANGAAHNNLPCSLPTSTDGLLEQRMETDALRVEVTALRKELSKCRDIIKKMQEKETVLKDRLSEQALKQLEKGSTKFEDLSLGDNRPTQLIRRYGNLYSETRLDAFDALEELPEIAEFDDLKGKLLFSVVVLAFRAVQRSLQDTRTKVRHLLCMPSPESRSSFSREPIVRELEDTISVYLRKFIDKYDSSKNVETPLHELTEEVCSQVWSTLYDYPSLRECSGLRQYITECVRLAWALSVQNPPLVIEYDNKIFSEDCHTRFHTSDPESQTIRSVLWPTLREGEHGPCVYKGVVIT